MFEVGVKEAGTQISDLEKKLDALVAKYGTMKIAVEIGNLDTFVNALKSIGNGEQLKPLLDRIQTLHNRLGALGDKGQYFDMLRGNAAAAAKEVEKAEEHLAAMKKTGNTGFIASAKDSLLSAQVEATRANEMLASATERFAKEEERVARETNNTKAQIDALGTSVTELHAKLGSGININFDTSKFSTWAAEVQGVSLAVKELVEQLKKLHQAEPKSDENTAIKSQTEEYKKEEEVLKSLIQKLEYYKRARERAEKTISDINAQYPNGFRQPWKDPSVHAAIQQDRELQEKTVASIDSKWDAFWRKHETQAVQFAQMLGKSLDGVTFDDFFKHATGKFQDLAKSWYAIFHSQGYDKTFLFDPDHEMKLLERLKELRKLKNEYRDSGTFQRVDPASAAELQVLESLKRKIDEYQNARNKALNADPNQTAAMEKLYAAETKHGEASVVVAAAKEKEAQYTKAIAEQQQKLNELQLKSTSNQTSQGNLFDPQKFAGLQEAIDKIISEINRLKEAFSGIGKIEGLSQMTTDINGLMHNVNNLKDVLSTLSSAVKIDQSSPLIKKLTADAEAAEKKIQELTEKLNAMSAAQNKVAESVAKSGKSETQVTDSQVAMLNRYKKLMADIHNIKREIVDIQRSDGGGGALGAQLGQYFSALNRVRNEIAKITSAPSLAEAISRGMSSEMLSKFSSSLAAIKSEFKEVVSGAKAFNKEFDKGSAKSEAAIRKMGMAFNVLKNYMKKNVGSEEMRKLQSEIQAVIQKMRQLMNAGDYGGALRLYERMSGLIRQASQATREYESSHHGLSSAVSKSTSELRAQSQVISDLKTIATQYLSVWGAQSFISNIIELGGQLEQQRLSIGAILQDTAQANQLFSKIKDLAVKSPFGVQQLDAMSKQLSAYGFKYSELYEWTKRLADISAATGTSVDRLALALGHVRSEGALTGYTLRQFSMGNIPLLQKLSENLGKTTQEIRKMTRNKEIGYEDVLNVLKQLTDEGGMFFEAQETMSEALNAKFKNLRDSFQIMYSEMAEGTPGDFLKGLATTLTTLSRQWQVLMPMIGAAGALWAMNRAASALVNVELAKMATLTNMNTLASSRYSVAQLRQIANWERMPKAMIKARLAVQGLQTSLISLGKYIFSWPTAIFAAVEGLVYMWAKQNRETEKAKELTESYMNTALESQKNISKQLSSMAPYEKGLADSEMKTGIESMTESIRNYGVNVQAVLEKVYGKDAEGKVMSLAEKYQYLRSELEKTQEVYKEMQRTSDVFEFGVEFSDGGWLDDDVQTDLTNLAEATKEYDDAFTKMAANYTYAVQKALEEVKKASPEFKRIADELASDAERVKWLYENQGENGGVFNLFKRALHTIDPDAGGGVLGYALGDNVRRAEKEVDKELDSFFRGVEEKLKKFGYNFEDNGRNLTELQVANLLKQSKEWLEKHPEWQNIYDVIWDKLNKRWGLPIVPDTTEIEEELPEWLENLQNELDKTGIKLTASMSMEQIVDEMKKAYDKAQTTINKLGPIAMQAKINFHGLSDEDIEKYKFISPELYETLKQLKGAQDSLSQIDTAGKKRGLEFNGMKKDGTHKAEKQNQEAAKAVREQVRVIKEAADAFQYWRDKVGDQGAWVHVQAEFGDVLDKIGITAQNVEDVRERLNNIPKTKAYKAISDKKVKTEIDKEIAKENDQFTRKDFEKNTEEFLSKTQIQLDNLTRSWETFNSVRDATGNIELAVQLSGAGYQAGTNVNLADAIRKKIEGDFAAAGAIAIPFDINFSDEEIFNRISAAMPEKTQDQIKGIVEEYKKWRDLQRDVVKTDIQNFGKLLGSVVDYKSEIQKLNDEYNKQKEMLDALYALGMIDKNAYDKAMGIIATNKDDAIWQKSATYIDLMNHSLAMTKPEIDAAARAQEENLNAKLAAGTIKAEDFYQEMVKLRKITTEWNTEGFLGSKGAFGSFVSGGNQGLMDYYDKRRNRAWRDYSNADAKDSPEAQEKLIEAQHYDKLYQSLAKLTDSAEDVVNAFQTLQGGVDLLGNLFDSLGMGSAATAMSDAGGLLSGALGGASSLSALGPYGMAAGAALGLATSIAELNDKGIQREIEALQDNVEALEANTNSIRAARERTLGYDTGVLRRAMSGLYEDTSKKINFFGKDLTVTSAAKKAMKEYYNAGTNKTGYAAELENLKEMRENYLEMYDKENSKKKTSQSALNEYKQKMAELDEQIMFFVEDLANELWGIDFKAWASQISDALWTAFENGESALDAFHDAAKDIISDVAKRMMNIHLIEPVFQQLEERLFGKMENGKRVGGAAYNYDTGQFNENETLKILGEVFGENGEFAKVISAAEDFYNMAKAVTGFDFGEDSTGSRSSSAISKAITEEQSNLLIALVNTIRADVSVNRTMIAQYFPLYYQALTSGNETLGSIAMNTRAIMESNATIAQRVSNLDDSINGLKNRVWRLPVS